MPTETSALEHVPAAFDCYNSNDDYDDWWEIDSSEYTKALTEGTNLRSLHSLLRSHQRGREIPWRP